MQGIYVSPTEFVPFAEPPGRSLSREIATRERSWDYGGLRLMLPNPDPVLRKMGKSVEIYNELEVDPLVAGCLVRRRGAVTDLESGFADTEGVPARILKSCKDMLGDLPISQLVEDSIRAADFGYQPIELVWGKVGGYQIPAGITAKPQEWFSFGPEGDLRFLARDAGLNGEAVEDKKFLLPRQRPSYKNPYGFADLSMCFWPVVFKKAGFKFWLKFCEKYGMPWPVGKYPKGTNPAEVSSLLDKLEQMVQDGVAAIPADSGVEFMKVDGSQNAQAYEMFLMFCRSEVSIGLLGQNQSTEASANLASAKAAQGVVKHIRNSHARLAESAVNQLFAWIGELNFAGRVPAWSLWEQQEVDEVQAGRDEKLVKSGARLTRAYWMRAYNLQEDDLEPDAPAGGGTNYAAKLAALNARKSGADVAFAEAAATFPAQAELDAALSRLAESGELQTQAEALLKPVFSALKGLENEGEVAAALLQAYPDMDASKLTGTMTRLYFAAELAGRLSVAEELAEG